MTLRRGARVVVWLWLWELACAVLVATPLHSWARSEWGAHPDGDAAFYRPGGHALLSWLDDGTVALPVVVRTSLFALVVCSLLGHVVTGAAVAGLVLDEDGRPPSFARAARAGLAAFLPLALFGVVASLVEGLVVGAGAAAAAATNHLLQSSLGEVRAFTIHLVPFGLFCAFALVVGVVADLVRVEIARGVAREEPLTTPRRIVLCARAAFRTARRSLLRPTLAWAWRAALGLGLLAFGSFASDVVGGRGGAALAALFVVHQLIMLGRAALRVSWLARALRWGRWADQWRSDL